MLQAILIVTMGVVAGWTGGRLMDCAVRATHANMFIGALGALAVLSAARWAGMDGVDRPAQTLVLALLGALLSTFVAGLVRQWRAPGAWVAERVALADASGRAS